jgi:peptidoglycan hydrolase-like protein with peptidoglycan-binding domain
VSAKLQQRLKELGLYNGPINGEASRALREAVAAYHDRDLQDEEVERLLDEAVRRRRQ